MIMVEIMMEMMMVVMLIVVVVMLIVVGVVVMMMMMMIAASYCGSMTMVLPRRKHNSWLSPTITCQRTVA